MIQVKNLQAAAGALTEYWSPKVVGEVDDLYVKVAKVKGELSEGDFYVMPKGVMHLPVAEDECWLALLERKTTKHTGDIQGEQTKAIEDQLV